jgi:hypothetical protein
MDGLMHRPLGLTDVQMGELRRAAATLPVEARDAFLRAVAHRLTKPNPTNDDVAAAISSVLSDTSVRVTTPMFCCDAQPKEKTDAAQPVPARPSR